MSTTREAGTAEGSTRRSAEKSKNAVPEGVEPIISHFSPEGAKLLACEILLADPASLGDDVLESSLYLFRDRLTRG